MRQQVSKAQFKQRALELMREVEATGEVLVVTDNGRPAVEISAYRERVRDPLALLRGSVKSYEDPLAPVGEGEWEALK